MKIEKINDNQIRCTLNSADLTDRQLNVGELAYGSAKARNLFREMMQQAFNDFGFEAEDNPLMVEAIPLSGDSIMLIITKVQDPEELDTRFAKFSPSSEEDFSEEEAPAPETLEGAPAPTASESPEAPQTPGQTRFFRFPTLDAATGAAQVIGDSFDGHSSLYRDPVSRGFFLAINGHGYRTEEFSRILNTLSEFGARVKANDAREAYFREHYDTVIDGLAVQVLKSL